GIDVALEDITNVGGLLSYQGEQILLYIKDTKQPKDILINEPEKSRRFHIAECATLEEMRRKNRFDRYHIANRIDGKFLCSWFNAETGAYGEVEASLKVCKNCLSTLNWENYTNINYERKKAVWNAFDIPEFLREYET